MSGEVKGEEVKGEVEGEVKKEEVKEGFLVKGKFKIIKRKNSEKVEDSKNAKLRKSVSYRRVLQKCSLVSNKIVEGAK